MYTHRFPDWVVLGEGGFEWNFSSPGFSRLTIVALSGRYLYGILSNMGAKITIMARVLWASLDFVLPLEDVGEGLLRKELFLQSFCPKGRFLTLPSK